MYLSLAAVGEPHLPLFAIKASRNHLSACACVESLSTVVVMLAMKGAVLASARLPNVWPSGARVVLSIQLPAPMTMALSRNTFALVHADVH